MPWSRLIGAAWLLLAACSFQPGAAGTDAAPPPPPTVAFTSVVASATELRPGDYGVAVEAVLRNGLDVAVAQIAPTLTFVDGAADRSAEFRWRDADAREGVTKPPVTLAPGEQATYRFVVDVMPWAAAGPVVLDAAATYVAGDAASALPFAPAVEIAIVLDNAPIRVDDSSDTSGSDAKTSFREALALAASRPGFDRIEFDPVEFPPDSGTRITLAPTPLPAIDVTGGGLVITAHAASVEIAADSSWRDNQQWALHLTGGKLVVHGLAFRDWAYNYPFHDLENDICAGGELQGGAIRVDGGTLILDDNLFADPSVAERNCYGAAVLVIGGRDHLIVNNTWKQQTMDILRILAPVREVTNNLIIQVDNLDRLDDAIVVENHGDDDVWIVGNVIVDQKYSAVFVPGTDTGTLHIVHNTFARNARGGGGAAIRGGGRPHHVRNNVYIDNLAEALQPVDMGVGFDIAYETTAGSGLCVAPACDLALIAADTIAEQVTDMLVVDPAGNRRDDFDPVAGSPLVDSAEVLLDRNGRAPGWFDGAGPDRGARELR